MIFNSIGSNYNLTDVLQMLFARGNQADSTKLKQALGQQFGGRAELYYRGRGALTEALRLSAPVGTSVAVNGFTCYAVEQAADHAGQKIIYVDVEAEEYHYNLEQLAQAVKDSLALNTVIVQNTFGVATDIKPIEDFCRQHHLILIEDMAHCLGGFYRDGRKMGTVGDIVMLSFGRDKMIDVVNGGALVVRHPELQRKLKQPQLDSSRKQRLKDRFYPLLSWLVRKLYPILIGRALHQLFRSWGWMQNSADGNIFDNTYMPHSRAKLVHSRLKNLEKDIERRQKLASVYDKELNEPNPRGALLRYPVDALEREALLKQLGKKGFQLHDFWYDSPVYPKRFLSQSNYQLGQCPNAERSASLVVNLPMHKNISLRKAQQLAEIIEGKYDHS